VKVKYKMVNIEPHQIRGITTENINKLLPYGVKFVPNCAVLLDEKGNASIVSDCGFRHLDNLEHKINDCLYHLSEFIDVNK